MTHPKRVLVIDDDKLIRRTIAEVLEMEGFDVETAPDGKAALAVIERRPPDLIVLDMQMPEMDGWEFARQYRRRPGPHAPIVCVTASTDAGQRCREIQADGCLGKPFDLDALISCVTQPAHRERHAA